jgi:hypothetical protein
MRPESGGVAFQSHAALPAVGKKNNRARCSRHRVAEFRSAKNFLQLLGQSCNFRARGYAAGGTMSSAFFGIIVKVKLQG